MAKIVCQNHEGLVPPPKKKKKKTASTSSKENEKKTRKRGGATAAKTPTQFSPKVMAQIQAFAGIHILPQIEEQHPKGSALSQIEEQHSKGSTLTQIEEQHPKRSTLSHIEEQHPKGLSSLPQIELPGYTLRLYTRTEIHPKEVAWLID